MKMTNNEINSHDVETGISQEQKIVKKCEDNNKYIEGDDSLSNSFFIKGTKDMFKRTYSTISTSYSEELSSEKIFIRKSSQINKIFSPKTDYFNSILNYFRETEENLKNNNNEKNDYQKSNNYIEKHIYYQDIDWNKNNSKYETIESGEDNINNETLSNNNSQNTSKVNQNPKNNENNIIENNNNQIINNTTFLEAMKNLVGNKYDLSMSYLGYYTINCKSKKLIFIKFSTRWYANSFIYPKKFIIKHKK